MEQDTGKNETSVVSEEFGLDMASVDLLGELALADRLARGLVVVPGGGRPGTRRSACAWRQGVHRCVRGPGAPRAGC
jgi:hypothetical protein